MASRHLRKNPKLVKIVHLKIWISLKVFLQFRMVWRAGRQQRLTDHYTKHWRSPGVCSQSTACRKTLRCLVNTASKIIGSPSVMHLGYIQPSPHPQCWWQPSHSSLLISGRRCRSFWANYTTLVNTFIHQAVRMLNSVQHTHIQYLFPVGPSALDYTPETCTYCLWSYLSSGSLWNSDSLH